MSGFHRLRPMEYSDEEILDRMMPEMPVEKHPPGLCFTVREPDFAGLGIDAPRPGETVRFAALARCTATDYREDGCRLECELDFLALGDSKLAELEEGMRPSLCLTETECEKLDLEEECERGDMLHLVGTARVVGINDSEYGGKCLALQIVEMAVENEDEEAEE